MSTLNKNPLFKLIKSLSKSEKRYFKLYVSRHLINDFSQYIELFNVIEKQKEYSEKIIHRDLSGIIKNIPSTKYHLYQKILESLELFRKGKQVDSLIIQGISQASILFDKSFYEEAQLKIFKIKKLAYLHEQFELILNILQLENRIILKKISGQHTTNNLLEKVLEEEKRVIGILSIVNEYKALASEFDVYVKRVGMQHRSSEKKIRFKKIMQHPLIKHENKAVTIYSKKLLYYILQNYYLLTDSPEKATEYSVKSLKLIESTLDKKNRQDVLQYMNTLNNLLVIQLNNGDYSAGLKIVEKLKLIPIELNSKETDETNIKALQYGDIHEISIYNSLGKFAKAKTVADAIIPKFNKVKAEISDEYKLLLYIKLAYTYFAVNKYKDSLRWSNEILKLPKSELREDIRSAIRVLNLIIHFELNNTDFLEHINISARRYFKKRTESHTVESIVIAFMDKFQNLDKNEHISAFKKLKDEILTALRSPYEKPALKYFDFISWLDSKITNKPFAEVVQKNLK
jgi:hypothetical protein